MTGLSRVAVADTSSPEPGDGTAGLPGRIGVAEPGLPDKPAWAALLERHASIHAPSFPLQPGLSHPKPSASAPRSAPPSVLPRNEAGSILGPLSGGLPGPALPKQTSGLPPASPDPRSAGPPLAGPAPASPPVGSRPPYPEAVARRAPVPHQLAAGTPASANLRPRVTAVPSAPASGPARPPVTAAAVALLGAATSARPAGPPAAPGPAAARGAPTVPGTSKALGSAPPPNPGQGLAGSAAARALSSLAGASVRAHPDAQLAKAAGAPAPRPGLEPMGLSDLRSPEAVGAPQPEAHIPGYRDNDILPTKKKGFRFRLR